MRASLKDNNLVVIAESESESVSLRKWAEEYFGDGKMASFLVAYNIDNTNTEH